MLNKNGYEPKQPKVKKAVYIWLISNQTQQKPIAGAIRKEKALKFSKALGDIRFKSSDCWLSNMKKKKDFDFVIFLSSVRILNTRFPF